MEAQENDLSNEAAALADILKWSAELPAWQRDARRRLCGQTKLEAADITALVGICKGDTAGAPLEASHVRDPAASHAVVSLGALYGLSHVNALAPGERLSFGKSGVTVIYGLQGYLSRQAGLPEDEPGRPQDGYPLPSCGKRRMLRRGVCDRQLIDVRL